MIDYDKNPVMGRIARLIGYYGVEVQDGNLAPDEYVMNELDGIDKEIRAAERRGAVYALEWAWDELNHYFPFLDREACVKEGMAALYPNETESE